MPYEDRAGMTNYSFDELSDSAKDRARDWFRQRIEVEDWSEQVIEDAMRIAGLFGLDMHTRPVRLMGEGTRLEPSVYFDIDRGAFVSIEGLYSYRKGALQAVKAEAPQDTDLHALVATLQDVQRRNFYRLTATMSHGREFQTVDVDTDGPALSERDTDTVTEALRDFSSWILSNLRREYEYQMSDEAIDEAIRANEYEFDEDGSRI